jgi:hypothetical protein
MIVDQKLVEYLSHENIELGWCLKDYLNVDNSNSNLLEEFIESISDELITEYNMTKLNKNIAKEKIAIIILHKTIQEERIKYLKYNNDLPTPYDKLTGLINFDENYLINTDNLSYSRGVLKISDYVYHVMPSLQQKNSMFWTFIELDKISEYSSVSVRLDPFMYQHKDDHRIMINKMYVYGVPVDWKRINTLKGTIHAKWQADKPESSSYLFTEIVWDRRRDGVHFVCEETPNKSNVYLRGSRYFHAIYNPERKVFTHTDGAIRIYDSIELTQRDLVHVRNSGKIGKRVKIFKIDGDIKREDWCCLVSTFFVWNQDIYNYFKEF